MIRPVLKDAAFLQDVDNAREERKALSLWWLGQSGFLIQWNDSHLLVDPYLSDSLTKKYAGTDRPHVRMTEQVVAPESLDFIDVVACTHSHTDHLDGETLRPIFKASPNARLILPEASRSAAVERLRCDAAFPVGLDARQSASVGGFCFTGVAAAHETVEWDGGGRCRYLGYIIGAGPWKIYHAGDTLRYPGMVEEIRSYSVDVAILPINGRSPERGVAGNLNGAEAAEVALAVRARVAIPCHYDMFEFNTASPGLFADQCKELSQPYQILRNGERWTSTSLETRDTRPVVDG